MALVTWCDLALPDRPLDTNLYLVFASGCTTPVKAGVGWSRDLDAHLGWVPATLIGVEEVGLLPGMAVANPVFAVLEDYWKLQD